RPRLVRARSPDQTAVRNHDANAGLARTGRELAREASFADAALTTDQDEAPASAREPLQELVERLEGCSTTDEPGTVHVPAGGTRRTGRWTAAQSIEHRRDVAGISDAVRGPLGQEPEDQVFQLGRYFDAMLRRRHGWLFQMPLEDVPRGLSGER